MLRIQEENLTKKIKDRQDSIIQTLNSLSDWMDKYDYIIETGKIIKSMDEALKTDENVISGCQSKVWIASKMKDNKLRFYADSNAMITRGLIGLLLNVLDGLPPKSIIEADLYFLERTGLQSNLSPSRVNGLESIIKHMKRLATQTIENQNAL